MPAAVVEGQTLPPYVVDVRPEPMKVVAALLDDPVGIHWDLDQVRAQGMGNRLVNQGPMGAAYLTEMVVRFAGDVSALRSISVRLLGTVYDGDRLHCSGAVEAVDRAERTATLSLSAAVDGTPVLAGRAVIALQ